MNEFSKEHLEALKAKAKEHGIDPEILLSNAKKLYSDREVALAIVTRHFAKAQAECDKMGLCEESFHTSLFDIACTSFAAFFALKGMPKEVFIKNITGNLKNATNSGYTFANEKL